MSADSFCLQKFRVCTIQEKVSKVRTETSQTIEEHKQESDATQLTKRQNKRKYNHYSEHVIFWRFVPPVNAYRRKKRIQPLQLQFLAL